MEGWQAMTFGCLDMHQTNAIFKKLEKPSSLTNFVSWPVFYDTRLLRLWKIYPCVANLSTGML